MAKSDGKFLQMVNCGTVYKPARAAADAALAAGVSPKRVVEELAFVLASVLAAKGEDVNTAVTLWQQVEAVRNSASFYSGESRGDA